MSARPNAEEIKYLVLGGKNFSKLVMGSFDDAESADRYRQSCDEWYTELHPLYPFSVDTVEHNPPMWPNLNSLIGGLAEKASVAPRGKNGGRRERPVR